MIDLFVSAFFLGLIFNAAPGAILVESLRRGLRGGFFPAFAVQIGSLVGDFLWVILGLWGVSVLISLPYVEIPLAVAGAVLLGYLTYSSFMDGLQPVPPMEDSTSMAENKNALMTGVAVSVSNPWNITYWAALGGTISALSGETPTTEHFVIFVGGFMLSSVLWCFIASGAIAMTRKYLTPFLWRTLNFGCGIGLGLITIMVIKGIYTALEKTYL